MYIKVKNLFVIITIIIVIFGFYFLINNKDNMNESSFAMIEQDLNLWFVY